MSADSVAAARGAVFLDRDGVINRKAPEGSYVTSWGEFEFLPGALEGLARLARSAVPIVVVTNQRGIARGRMTEGDVADIHARMRSAVAAAGGRIDAVYHCPHDVGCRCRKPEVGMFQDAEADLGIALEESVVIGDQPSDMLAAERIGALRILIAADGEADADHVAAHLDDAVTWLHRHKRLPIDA